MLLNYSLCSNVIAQCMKLLNYALYSNITARYMKPKMTYSLKVINVTLCQSALLSYCTFYWISASHHWTMLNSYAEAVTHFSGEEQCLCSQNNFGMLSKNSFKVFNDQVHCNTCLAELFQWFFLSWYCFVEGVHVIKPLLISAYFTLSFQMLSFVLLLYWSIVPKNRIFSTLWMPNSLKKFDS